VVPARSASRPDLISINAAPAGSFKLSRMSTTLTLAERAVPRYTSYPTAPHFSPDVGADPYAAWLAALPVQATLSLYLHVPYCSELCLYCGCTTKAVRQAAPVAAYADRLRAEIDLLGAAIGGRRVVHLHWGGGTPSILGADALCGLVERLGGAFDLARLDEHAIELDPRRLTPDLVAALARMGVTRVSFGAQDFSPHVQQAIGRVQPFAMVEEAVAMVRDVGIGDVNIDLMYGLPKQTVGDVIRSAEAAAALAPSRIALFGYAHVPWFKPHQKLIDTGALPGAAERMAQMHAAAETLEECGYVAIGLDHFALRADDLARVARGKASPQLPGLHHRRRRRADRARRVLDRAAAAGLCAERAGCRVLRARDRGGAVRRRQGHRILGRRSQARRDHRAADV
jgi:oxygen-independent coproporphyrinogen III oxidase